MTVFSADLSFTPPVYTPSTSEKPGVGVRVGDQEKLPEPKVPVGGSDKYKPQIPPQDPETAQRVMAQLRQLLTGFGPLILACVPHDDTLPEVPGEQTPEPRDGYEKPEFLPQRPNPTDVLRGLVRPGMWGQTSTSQQLQVIGVGLVLGAALLAYETATAAFSFFVVPPEPQNNSVI